MSINGKLKSKKCRHCCLMFTPWNSLQVCCTPKCAISYTHSNQDKKVASAINKQRKSDRQALRARKTALKSKSDWLREAQTACNAYIREKDKNEPCISCGTTNPNIQYCAGHFKTRGGHPELRFHPFNIHRQCNKNCNLHLSGNIAEYRPRLIKKIGIENVEWLEGKHEAQHLTIEDIKEVKAYYKEQLKYLTQE